MWWHHHRALAAARRQADARKALDTAYALLLEGIATLSDEGLRRNYLNKIDSHREIVRAGSARAPPPPRREAASAHLAGEADLRAPFERLVDTGMRMNELRSVAELHEFLIDEVTELSGAERVLLVLEDADGRADRGIAAADGRGARSRCSATSTPWLDERAARVRSSLRHEPEGADCARPALAHRSRR